jgi:hypothetical protein
VKEKDLAAHLHRRRGGEAGINQHPDYRASQHVDWDKAIALFKQKRKKQ